MTPTEWIDLAEAARLLGIHQSTLRRWADLGKIQHVRTLSGRRRFTRSAIDQALKEMRHEQERVEVEQFEWKTLDLARKRSSDVTTRNANWYIRLSDEQRMLFRYSGQRLLGLMMQFISRQDSAETFLAEGKRVAGDYGQICYHAGLTVSQTAEAFLYFSRSILESVQATSGLGGPNDLDGNRIFMRTVEFFDTLLVATIEQYAELSQKT
jgi:excisionase family DNA binding protein